MFLVEKYWFTHFFRCVVLTWGPLYFDSELTHDILESEMVKQTIASVPLKRHGMEGELNGALLYFASDASSYCTGQILYVDGGYTSQI